MPTFATFGSEINTDPTVLVGQITPDDYDALYKDLPPEEVNSTWTDYFISNRYEYQHHISMLGVTAPNSNPSAAFVQLAAPNLLWVSDWTASRYVTKPKIPAPNIGNDWIILHEHYEPAMVTLGEDGVSPLYRISGTYIYGCVNPNFDTGEDMSFAAPAWMNTDDAEFSFTIDDDQFEDNLIDPD